MVSLDSGAGLANATLQQRLVPVRLFDEFLVEEGAASPTPSAVAVTRRAAGLAAGGGGWCPG